MRLRKRHTLTVTPDGICNLANELEAESSGGISFAEPHPNFPAIEVKEPKPSHHLNFPYMADGDDWKTNLHSCMPMHGTCKLRFYAQHVGAPANVHT